LMVGKLYNTKSIMVWSWLKNNIPSIGSISWLDLMTLYLPWLIHGRCTPNQLFLAIFSAMKFLTFSRSSPINF
jgi:hypothetical protein